MQMVEHHVSSEQYSKLLGELMRARNEGCDETEAARRALVHVGLEPCWFRENIIIVE